MDRSALVTTARDTLEQCQLGRDGERLDSPPTLDDVYQVNTNRDGDPVYVPVVELTLETEDDPELAAVYRLTATILRRLHPHFRDVHVRQYDLVFSYGTTSWWHWDVTKRRISARPQDVDALTRDAGFDAVDLRERLEEGDDGDDEIPPVAWGETLGEWEYYHDDSGDWSWMGGFGGFG
ncbi:hypothetical protein [Natronolimnobius baerhuensis]|uniref:Uncharacterized protein n=1 Tax=Natronolimnobius baerhuensis TaxID=253108 RepID=A0A202E791_9EURY|nr:hypothetical protein [Natronolimnobius baerhuensis]OVE84136.1 hypothetical protein B2G88_06835 [Natronolimnobius baerhuensis]